MAYRSVLRTIKHPNQLIVVIAYVDANRPEFTTPTFVTGNHPFWVEGRGWVAAGAIRPGYDLHGSDGRKLRVINVSPVYRSRTEGVGWCQLAPSYRKLGLDIDFSGPSWRLAKSKAYRSTKKFVDGPLLGVDVYGLEIEEFHTYYVGPAGVWLHHANCA
ncbi:hypothetical protein [Xanthomonas hortorum]|uniref:hypothetical protein n=1 Tax=Xanthomonas hortorum TaxID=56454 RepID=UPI00159393AA|nr:hypothetical protein [Xanthomonas hortorum]NHF67490.1 hypothetical protein [Xanthomonas hortorum]